MIKRVADLGQSQNNVPKPRARLWLTTKSYPRLRTVSHPHGRPFCLPTKGGCLVSGRHFLFVSRGSTLSTSSSSCIYCNIARYRDRPQNKKDTSVVNARLSCLDGGLVSYFFRPRQVRCKDGGASARANLRYTPLHSLIRKAPGRDI